MPGCWSAGTSTSAAFACPSPWQRLPVLPRTPGAVVVGARGGACGPVPAGCPLLGDALGAPAPFFPFCPQTGSVSALRRAPSVSMSLCSSFPASSSHNGDHGGWKDDSSRLISVAAAKAAPPCPACLLVQVFWALSRAVGSSGCWGQHVNRPGLLQKHCCHSVNALGRWPQSSSFPLHKTTAGRAGGRATSSHRYLLPSPRELIGSRRPTGRRWRSERPTRRRSTSPPTRPPSSPRWGASSCGGADVV